MRSGSIIFFLFFIIIMAASSCTTTVVRPAGSPVAGEDAAIAKLGNDIHAIQVLFHNKKIGIFYFSNLDWQITDAGRRISGKLTDYLVKRGGLTMIKRAELDAIMKTEAIEQTSMFDVETVQKGGKALTVDVIVFGTIVQDGGTVEIELKVIEIATGRLVLLSGVRLPATAAFTSRDKPEIISLYRKSPDKIAAMNKSYFSLKWMKAGHPLVFLLVVLKDGEVKSLKTTNAILYGKLIKRYERYEKERPDVMRKISNLRDGLSLMDRYEPQRLHEIMGWKKELLGKMK